MSRVQTYKEGEAAASQQAESNTGSKVRSERVALLLLSALLAAAAVVIYRLSFAHFQTNKNLQMLKDENEAMRENLTAESCPTCEPGWDQHGGSCYYFSSNKLNWNQSRSDCKGRGADLVQINSKEEQRFLDDKVGGKITSYIDSFWIGLTDSKEKGRWLWVDDSPLNTSLSFWYKNEPNNWTGENPAGEDCVMMGVQGGATDLKCWFDRSCKVPLRRICEKAAKTG
ncbi:C-type lectin domain family 4 member E-like [Betta splendens]|uniref:C-type lectin domain family 4 member E-like n=1 Tax=Betta splendens TaxID=158456 RepID=A0A9W2Y4V4_BETSP|nr:C-type lectin domain family 4 member E-like [Betta splendens]XP_055369004.1 C-type lectin domain family 4 member E-like [Betta splendens]